MSLIHWWPLNGDLNDRGTANNGLNVLYGSPTFNNGKIGQCANLTSGQAYYISDSMKCNSVTGYSVAAWVYFSSLDSNHRSGIWSNRSDGPVWSSCEVYNNKLHYYHYNNSWQSTFGNTTLTTDRWYHVCFVIKNRVVTFYLDGVNDGSGDATLSGDNQNLCDSVGCSWSSSYALRGFLNDVRIYDHALSAKEVKEISKGLVLHYDFNDPYVEGTTNLASQDWYIYWNNAGEASQNFNDTSLVSPTNSKIYSQTQTTAGQSAFGMGLSSEALPSQTITVSTWFYRSGTPSNDAISPFIRDGNTDAWLGMFSYNGSDNYRDWPENTWIFLSKTITTDSSVGRPYICCYTGGLNEKVAYTGWQIEKKDHATPYVNGTRPAGTVYDSSGYGYNASPINNPQLVKDSGCGQYSVRLLNNANGYYKIDKVAALNFITNGTVSFWAKFPDNNYKMLFGTDDSGEKYYLAWHDGTSWYSSLGGSQGTCYCDGVARNSPIIDNNWHLYTFVGVNFSGWGDAKHYYLCRYAGSQDNPFQFHGYLADLKIYSTALSASDILAEYNRKASIDRNGNLFTGEFIEQNGNAKLPTKTGQVVSTQFVEGSDKTKIFGGYTELEYIESTGTQYIDTGVTSGDNITRLEAHYYRTTTETRQILFGMWNSGNIAIYFDYTENATALKCYWYGGNIQTSRPAAIEEMRSYLYLDGSTFHFAYNDTMGSGSATVSPTGSTHNYLFADNDNGNPIYFFKGKLYSFKIYVDGIITRNFIPVKRNSDNAIGLFDTVQCKFYQNAGSGTFTAGNELGLLSIVCTNELNEL